MPTETLWTHGNALVIESKAVLAEQLNHGYGADMTLHASAASWFHIPIPSPPQDSTTAVWLSRVFLLYDIDQAFLTNVHIYDGKKKIAEFNNLQLGAYHGNAVDAQNTFTLPTPHAVQTGIGISFRTVAVESNEIVIPRIRIAAAGGEYTTETSFLRNLFQFFFLRSR